MLKKMRPSKRFELNKEDLKRIVRQMLIIYTPVVILFLDQIQYWGFDLKIIWALAISVTVDIFRRYIRDFGETEDYTK